MSGLWLVMDAINVVNIMNIYVDKAFKLSGRGFLFKGATLSSLYGFNWLN